LFEGVRDHAGRVRSSDFGSETLAFGPNRSAHRNDVETRLRSIFNDLHRAVTSFDANPNAPDYELSAIHMAVWVHAEIVRVHPFEDGNGRASRLLMNWVLLRVGLAPIQVDAPKQEYFDCLNHFFRTGDIVPLRDLAIRLYEGI
jgi:fido (protein-threonine AMPylation protein)